MKHLYIILFILPLIGFGQTTFLCDCVDENITMIFSVDKVNKKISHLKSINKNIPPGDGTYNEKFEYQNLVWKDYGVFQFKVLDLYNSSWDRVEFRSWDFINNTFTEEYYDETPTKRTYECYE